MACCLAMSLTLLRMGLSVFTFAVLRTIVVVVVVVRLFDCYRIHA